MARSVVELFVKQIGSGNALSEAALDLKSIASSSKLADGSLGDMRLRLRQLNSEFENISTTDDDFNRVGREIAELNSEIKRATRSARGLDDELDSAGGGIGVFDIALGNIAANGLSSFIDIAGRAGSALLELGSDSLNVASSFGETEDLLSTVLGPAYDDYTARLDEVAESTGRSSRAIQEGSKLIINTISNAGFSADQVSVLGAEIGSLALDLESLTDQEGALDAFLSGFAGESEPLRRFGVDTRDAALRQVALKEGIIETSRALSDQERIQSIIAQVYNQQSVAIGNATKTSEAHANIQRSLTELADDYKASLGAVVQEGILPLEKALLKFGKSSLPTFERELGKTAEEISDLTLGVGAFLEKRGEINSDSGGNALFGAAILGGIDTIANVTGLAALSEQVEKLKDVGEITARVAEQREAAAASLEQSDAKLLNSRAFEELDPEPALNYATSVTQAAKAYQLGVDIFNESDFAAIDDAFGGETVSNIDAVADAVSRVSTNVSTLVTKAAEFTGGDLLNTTVDEAGLFAEVAERLPENVDIGLTLNLLREDGTPAEDLEAIGRELIENQLGENLVAQFDAGLLTQQELIDKTKELSEELATLEDPFLLIEQGVGAVSDALNDIPNDVQSIFTLNIEGLEELREVKTLVDELAGVNIGGDDLPQQSTLVAGVSSNTGNNVAAVASRRGLAR